MTVVVESPAAALDLVGTTFGPGEWLLVDQERVDGFADVTGDHQWIHVDRERAAAGPFGGTIAHGYLTLSLVPVLAADLVAYEGCSAKINYGCDKVRFPAPLPVGSRVRASGELVAAREVRAGVQVTVRWTIEVADVSGAASGDASRDASEDASEDANGDASGDASGDGSANAKPVCVADTLVLLVP